MQKKKFQSRVVNLYTDGANPRRKLFHEAIFHLGNISSVESGCKIYLYDGVYIIQRNPVLRAREVYTREYSIVYYTRVQIYMRRIRARSGPGTAIQ